MFTLLRYRILEGITDAKFLFFFVPAVLAFLFNGLIYSDKYIQESKDYQKAETEVSQQINEASPNLQFLAELRRQVLMPPSGLSFIADGGSRLLPNFVATNAFRRNEPGLRHRSNYKLPVLLEIDWAFIVGGLFSLLAIMLSFRVVCGEKRDGTLRQILSNPLSRLTLFFGNYLGLLVVISAALLLCVLVNLLTIQFSGGPGLSADTLAGIGWSLILSLLYLSVFLLAGLAVSAMTARPAVALVVLLVIWVLAVAVAPGLGRLAAEQMVQIPSQRQVIDEQERLGDEIWNSYPKEIGRLSGDPFEPQMPQRAQATREISAAQQRIRDAAFAAQVRQVRTAQSLASVSPFGLYSDGLQSISDTGIQGVELLLENAERYRQQLHAMVVERDRQDSKSAHLVYGDSYIERGTFSQLPVPVEVVPRASALWTESGLSKERPWPWWQLLGLLGFNLLAGLIAFVALLRYDPR